MRQGQGTRMAALPLVLLVPLVCGRTLVCSQSHTLGIGESQSFCVPDPAHSQRAWEPTHVVHVVPQVSGRPRMARGSNRGQGLWLVSRLDRLSPSYPEEHTWCKQEWGEVKTPEKGPISLPRSWICLFSMGRLLSGRKPKRRMGTAGAPALPAVPVCLLKGDGGLTAAPVARKNPWMLVFVSPRPIIHLYRMGARAKQTLRGGARWERAGERGRKDNKNEPSKRVDEVSLRQHGLLALLPPPTDPHRAFLWDTQRRHPYRKSSWIYALDFLEAFHSFTASHACRDEVRRPGFETQLCLQVPVCPRAGPLPSLGLCLLTR